jgi:hypothetical protein
MTTRPGAAAVRTVTSSAVAPGNPLLHVAAQVGPPLVLDVLDELDVPLLDALEAPLEDVALEDDAAPDPLLAVVVELGEPPPDAAVLPEPCPPAPPFPASV